MSISFQPVLQQDSCTSSLFSLHTHVFCRRAYASPVFDQSVVSAVILPSWKVVNPSLTAPTMWAFAALKAVSSSWDHWNGIFSFAAVLISVLKGAITSFFAKKWATCSTSPQNDLAPVMLVGLGKSLMASSIFSLGFIPCSVTLNPRKSISLWQNWNLRRL